MALSSRKLESYRRAEKVAQASRLLMVAGAHPSQEAWDLWSDCVLDWMNVTGRIKYEAPKRRVRATSTLKY